MRHAVLEDLVEAFSWLVVQYLYVLMSGESARFLLACFTAVSHRDARYFAR